MEMDSAYRRSIIAKPDNLPCKLIFIRKNLTSFLCAILFLICAFPIPGCCADFLYVADTVAKVVHKFTLEGSYVKAIGSGTLSNPHNCIFDSQGNLIVADRNSLKVFKNDVYLKTFGSGYFDT